MGDQAQPAQHAAAPGPELEPGAEAAQTAVFKGQTFTLNDDISEWAILEFAEAVDSGMDGAEMQGLAALLRFVVELIHPADRDRFRSLARKQRATAEDLFEFLTGKVEVDAERPTGRSSDSSDGPESIPPKHALNSAGKGSRTSGLHLLAGRPDLQLMVEAARKSA